MTLPIADFPLTFSPSIEQQIALVWKDLIFLTYTPYAMATPITVYIAWFTIPQWKN